MASQYKNLFFDLDDTLWAFSLNARDTFEEMYQKYDYDRFFRSFQHFYTLYQYRNVELWEEYGRGNQFDWNLLHRYNGPTPFLLSGGINPYSVKALREFRHPYFAGIDINSRFETAPGIKDVERISNFLKELKGGTI